MNQQKDLKNSLLSNLVLFTKTEIFAEISKAMTMEDIFRTLLAFLQTVGTIIGDDKAEEILEEMDVLFESCRKSGVIDSLKQTVNSFNEALIPTDFDALLANETIESIDPSLSENEVVGLMYDNTEYETQLNECPTIDSYKV